MTSTLRAVLILAVLGFILVVASSAQTISVNVADSSKATAECYSDGCSVQLHSTLVATATAISKQLPARANSSLVVGSSTYAVTYTNGDYSVAGPDSTSTFPNASSMRLYLDGIIREVLGAPQRRTRTAP